MSSLRLTQKLAQRMVLTPQLRQRIEMLQMTTMELSELIQNELVANPVLEEVFTDEEFQEFSEKILDQNADGAPEQNEVAQTVAETNVVVTQPKRRATGDYAQYTAETESIILRGNPARIEDAESGSTQGAQVTVFLRENRVVGESKAGQTNTGRSRSIYKIKKQ